MPRHYSAIPHICRLIIVLFAFSGIISCGGGHTSLGTSTSTRAAHVTINSNILSFGTVTVGSSKSSAVTMTNTSGGPDVIVNDITASGSGYVVKSPTTPITLASGQSLSLAVTFRPISAGKSDGRLSVSIQGHSAPVLVELSGTGKAGAGPDVRELGSSPAMMNFGTVAVGHTQRISGLLSAGAADVNISSASWKGQGYALNGITFPMTVRAGRNIRFTVSFNPELAGTASGQVSFFSNAANSPTVVNLTGMGIQRSEHSVKLSWNASTSRVAGYNIYRRTQSGPYVRLNRSPNTELTFTDDTVQSGTTYYYVVTSVNSKKHESIYSNFAKADIF